MSETLTVYLVVRESLGMDAGKIASQCAHAIRLLTNAPEEINWATYNRDEAMGILYDKIIEWQQCELPKIIVLKADDKEFLKVKNIHKPLIVKDAGLTQVPPGTETVAAIWPMYPDESCKILKRLRLL